jgi:hypothetical protein
MPSLAKYLPRNRNKATIGSAVLILDVYAPFNWKTNFKMSTNLGKNIRGKPTFFVGCAKKKNVAKRLILIPNFIIFTLAI